MDKSVFIFTTISSVFWITFLGLGLKEQSTLTGILIGLNIMVLVYNVYFLLTGEDNE